MKKNLLYIIVTVLALTLLLSACSENMQGTATQTPENINDTPSSPTGTQSGTKIPAPDDHTHTFGEWVTKDEPTCEKEGKKERTCECGEMESTAIPVVSHKYSGGACTVCGKKDENAFVPDYKKGEENTVGSDLSASSVASQGDWIYYASSSYKISKMTKLGTNRKDVYKVSGGMVTNLNVVGDWIYFSCEGTTEGKSYIAKVRTDGSGFEKLVTSVIAGDMLVVKDKIFYTIYKNKYTDYAKDIRPLYSVSVNGGTSKMIHDGAVTSLRSNGTHVFFLHTSQNGANTVYRMKADGTNIVALLTKTELNYITVEDSKIYFLRFDKYSEECIIASISTNGGSYTEYGRIPYYSEFLHAVGSKLYYGGLVYSANGYFHEEVGLVEFDTNTKTYKLLKEDYECDEYYFTSDLLMKPVFTGETLSSFNVYDAPRRTFRTLKTK